MVALVLWIRIITQYAHVEVATREINVKLARFVKTNVKTEPFASIIHSREELTHAFA